MKKIFALLSMSVLSFAAQAADLGCTLKNVAGDYAFNAIGDRAGVGKVAAVGLFNVSSTGVVSAGRQATSFNGKILSETFTGTATLQPDCWGNASLTITTAGVSTPRTAKFFFVVSERQDRIDMIFTDAGTISTVVATRIGR